ncbi:MAG: hypothetical protein M1812_007868 [Candelaria pacifica]|nr:MAG: hypothetical protein M1812_007868 [Candelaria pacifica]
MAEESNLFEDLQSLYSALPESISQRRGKPKNLQQSIDAVHSRAPEGDDLLQHLDHEMSLTYKTNKILPKQMEGFAADLRGLKAQASQFEAVTGEVNELRGSITQMDSKLDLLLQQSGKAAVPLSKTAPSSSFPSFPPPSPEQEKRLLGYKDGRDTGDKEGFASSSGGGKGKGKEHGNLMKNLDTLTQALVKLLGTSGTTFGTPAAAPTAKER